MGEAKRPGRLDTGLSWAALVIGRGLIVVLLLFIFALAAFLVDALETMVPLAPPANADTCQPTRWLTAISAATFPSNCLWEDATNPSVIDPAAYAVNSHWFDRRVTLNITEATDGTYSAIATITMPAANPVVALVRHGDAIQDPASFSQVVVGNVEIGDTSFNWAPPVLASNSDTENALPSLEQMITGCQPYPISVLCRQHGTATISQSGTEETGGFGSVRGPATPLTLSAAIYGSGTISITSKSRVIAGVQVPHPGFGFLVVTSQRPKSISAKSAGCCGVLTVTLTPAAAQTQNFLPPSLTVSGWPSDAVSAAWGLLRNFTESLLPAIPWIVLFLASRAGLFAPVSRYPAWQRMERLVGLVLLAHIVLSAINEITIQEQRFQPPLHNKIFSIMDRPSLWQAGYAPEFGGIVLLIALIVCSAGWWSRPPKIIPQRGRSLVPGAKVAPDRATKAANDPATKAPAKAKRGRFAVDLLVPVALASAIWGFAWLAKIWAGTGKQHQWSVPRVAVPLAVLLALSCLAIAAFYLSRLLSRPLPMLKPTDTADSRPEPGHQPTATAHTQQTSSPGHPVLAFMTSAALMAACAIAPYFIITLVRHASFVPHRAGWAFLGLTVAAVIVFTSLVAISRPRKARDGARFSWIVAATAMLGLAAALTADAGYLPLILNWGVVLAVGLITSLAVVRLAVAMIFRQSQPTYKHRTTLALLALLIAVPWGALAFTDGQIGWWALGAYALRIDSLLGLILVAAGVVTLRILGRTAIATPQTIRAGRALGIALWFIVLSSSYTLPGGYTVAVGAAVVAAGIGAFLLMPASQAHNAIIVLRQSDGEQRRAVTQTLQAGAARRFLPGASKALNDQVTSDSGITFAEAQERIAAIERQTATPEDADNTAVSSEQRGFGALASHRPWDRGRWGLLVGAIIGAPWVLLGLAGTSLQVSGDSYPELAVIASVAPLIIRWAGYGLLFGYFFPLLRGTTGLSKAVWLLVAAVIPALCETLATGHTTASQWHSTVLLLVQLFGFAMTMGILADRAVLRKYGQPTRRLIDLHNLWTVSAWASSVAVALATGIATLVLAGLQPFVIGVLSPASPPAATSHQNPGPGRTP